MINKSISAKNLALIAALVLMITGVLGTLTPSHATLTAVPTPTQIDSISSSNTYTG